MCCPRAATLSGYSVAVGLKAMTALVKLAETMQELTGRLARQTRRHPTPAFPTGSHEVKGWIPGVPACALSARPETRARTHSAESGTETRNTATVHCRPAGARTRMRIRRR